MCINMNGASNVPPRGETSLLTSSIVTPVLSERRLLSMGGEGQGQGQGQGKNCADNTYSYIIVLLYIMDRISKIKK